MHEKTKCTSPISKPRSTAVERLSLFGFSIVFHTFKDFNYKNLRNSFLITPMVKLRIPKYV